MEPKSFQVTWPRLSKNDSPDREMRLLLGLMNQHKDEEFYLKLLLSSYLFESHL